MLSSTVSLGEVLWVEDNSRIVSAFGEKLKRAGLRYRHVETKEEAVQEAHSHRFMGGIFDLRLARGNAQDEGMEALRDVKAVQPGMRCVVFTGFVGDVTADEVVLAGGIAKIDKENPDQLIATLLGPLGTTAAQLSRAPARLVVAGKALLGLAALMGIGSFWRSWGIHGAAATYVAVIMGGELWLVGYLQQLFLKQKVEEIRLRATRGNASFFAV